MKENEKDLIPDRKLEKVTGGQMPTVDEHGYDEYTQDCAMSAPVGYSPDDF